MNNHEPIAHISEDGREHLLEDHFTGTADYKLEVKVLEYNLIEKQWIPVLWTDGRVGRVGIREALTKSGQIRQIAASNPMDRVAILRFLLAVLYWCKENPPEDIDVTKLDSFPPDWFAKLDGHKEWFNLFGDGKRFYQCHSEAQKKLSANYLVQEIPTGTNMWHFRHSIDNRNGLCPACCATGLLRLPLFATSGGRGKPPGINSKPPIYAIPLGLSLAQTLILSWRHKSVFGTPSWEKPDQRIPKTGEVPFLTGLTWLPRRVWLDTPDKNESTCISCGRKEQLIRQCVFAGIGSTKANEEEPKRIWQDPHVIYDTNSKGETLSLHANDVLGASDVAAGQWARILSGIIRNYEMLRFVNRIWIVGFATVQNDKYLEAMEWVLPPLPSSLNIIASSGQIEQWQKEGRDLRKRVGRSRTIRIAAISGIRPHVEGRVSSRISELLAGGDDVWSQAAFEYQPMIKAISKSISPGFTTAAVERRQQIEKIMPDMRPRKITTQKSKRKKGDNK